MIQLTGHYYETFKRLMETGKYEPSVRVLYKQPSEHPLEPKGTLTRK
jgi:hypothetical protein